METIRNLKDYNILPASPTLLNRLNIKSAAYIKYRSDELLNKWELINYNSSLRPYQNQGVNFIVKSKNPGLAIFDEQRLGKTPTILTALKYKHANAIIIVPKSLLYQWYAEYKKWYNNDIILIDGDSKKRNELYKKTTSSIILSYNTASADIEILEKFKHFDYIVIDEAHRLRNLKKGQKNKPQIALAVLKLARKIPNRIALSGTPAPNLADDIFGILSFLYPSLFTSYYAFRDYYFITEECYTKSKTGELKVIQKPTGRFKKGKQQELLEFLETISIQRKRKEVMQWLPQYDITKQLLPMDNEQQIANESLKTVFEYKDTVCLDALSLMLAQRQLAIAPELIGCPTLGCKFNYIKDYINDYPEKSIIIVSTLVEPLKILSNHLPKHEFVYGKTSPRARDSIKTKFQEGKSKLLLANLDVIKEGFTLDKADAIIFLDSSYVYTDNQQCMDRLVPVSKERVHNKPQEIILLIAEGSIDEYIYEMVYIKKASSSDIINNYKLYRKE